MHFGSIKCFVIICKLWNIISAKRVCFFINWLPIFSEILHRCEHHLLLIAFQRIVLFTGLNFKVELRSLDIVNIILLPNACLMILILNLKWLGIIIVTWGISKHIIISELLLFLIKTYLLPQSMLTLILLRSWMIWGLIVYSDFVSFHPVDFCFLHLGTYQIIIIEKVLLILIILIWNPLLFDLIWIWLIDMGEGLCVGSLSELIVYFWLLIVWTEVFLILCFFNFLFILCLIICHYFLLLFFK